MIEFWKENEHYEIVDGRVELKKEYLLQRGYCCKGGCKNCPYGYRKKTSTQEVKVVQEE